MRFVPKSSIKGCDGMCYIDQKCIKIASGIRNKNELTTIIHELLHATTWILSEDHVDQAAKDIGNVLYKLGYRKVEN